MLKEGDFMFDRNFFHNVSMLENFKISGNEQHFYMFIDNSSFTYLEFFLLEEGGMLVFYKIRNRHLNKIDFPLANQIANSISVNLCIKGRCDFC